MDNSITELGLKKITDGLSSVLIASNPNSRDKNNIISISTIN